MVKVMWVITRSVAAAALGGIAAIEYSSACSQLHYIAETSGQIAIGTGVYGLALQISDLVSDWWDQRPLHRALASDLRDYVTAAEARRREPRDHRRLEARICELRDRRPRRERMHFERALRELEQHGTAGEFALLSDDVQTTHTRALAARLG